MNTVAYALATALLLIAASPVAVADDPEAEPASPPPCLWFEYSINPPDAVVRPECIEKPWPLD